MRDFDEFIKTAGIGSTALKYGVKALNNNVVKSSLGGAAIGAGLGAITAQPGADGKTHRFRNAMVGATAGAGAGAAVGGLRNMGTVTEQGVKNGINNIGNKVSGFFNSADKTASQLLDEMVKEAGIKESATMFGTKAKMNASMAGLRLKMLPMTMKAKRWAKKHPELAQQSSQGEGSKENTTDSADTNKKVASITSPSEKEKAHINEEAPGIDAPVVDNTTKKR